MKNRWNMRRVVHNMVLHPLSELMWLLSGSKSAAHWVHDLCVPRARKPKHTYTDNHGLTYDVADLWRLAETSPSYPEAVAKLVAVQESVVLDLVAWGDVLKYIVRAQKADKEYPIILDPEGSLADGAHRLLWLAATGHKTVKVVKLKSMPTPL